MNAVGSVRMVGKTPGIMGELGRITKSDEELIQEPINIEILSLGPLFNQIDYGRLYWQTQRAPFFKHVPI
ncbi:hypothetical protein KKF81_00050 [Candidatus Micrarchaeota archaeon]|nr:hypothetical protein [Candidatus Micrarchaeota archaeon]MBU1165308.1 hypothetical protein [Candidatus Micrarchaeota archaeon]MBU1886136.1 hypothetical protein [Candidatus Micrarchaeota archaeon]